MRLSATMQLQVQQQEQQQHRPIIHQSCNHSVASHAMPMIGGSQTRTRQLTLLVLICVLGSVLGRYLFRSSDLPVVYLFLNGLSILQTLIVSSCTILVCTLFACSLLMCSLGCSLLLYTVLARTVLVCAVSALLFLLL